MHDLGKLSAKMLQNFISANIYFFPSHSIVHSFFYPLISLFLFRMILQRLLSAFFGISQPTEVANGRPAVVMCTPATIHT